MYTTSKILLIIHNKITFLKKSIRKYKRYILSSISLRSKDNIHKYIYILFVAPYKYPPNLPIDVDYRVMCTFLDFYITLMKFVNYKLYAGVGLVYPPE